MAITVVEARRPLVRLPERTAWLERKLAAVEAETLRRTYAERQLMEAIYCMLPSNHELRRDIEQWHAEYYRGLFGEAEWATWFAKRDAIVARCRERVC